MFVRDFINKNFTDILSSDIEDKIKEYEECANFECQKKTNIIKNVDEETKSEIEDQSKLEIKKFLNQIKKDKTNLDLHEKLDKLIIKYENLKEFSNLKFCFIKKSNEKKFINFLVQTRIFANSIKIVDKPEIKDIKNLLEKIVTFRKENIEYESYVDLYFNNILESQVQKKKQDLMNEFVCYLDLIDWKFSETVLQSYTNEQIQKTSELFSNLVELQSLDNKPVYPDTWWALDILLKPVLIKFAYHFDTMNKETSNLSKADWSLNFFENFLSVNSTFLRSIVDDVFVLKDRFGIYEIITTILIPLKNKFAKAFRILNKILNTNEGLNEIFKKNGQVLSFLISKLSLFDQKLIYNYKYNPYINKLDETPYKQWNGLLNDILVDNNLEQSIISKWLDFEYINALKMFVTEVLEIKNPYEIDYDYKIVISQTDFDFCQLKSINPTFSAFNLVKILKHLTSNIDSLNDGRYQKKYLIKIHLELTNKYLQNLNKILKKFTDNFNTNSVLNLIPGAITNESKSSDKDYDTLETLKKLETLIELFCLSKFVFNELKKLSNNSYCIKVPENLNVINDSYLFINSNIFDKIIIEYENFINKIMTQLDEFFIKETKQNLKNYVNNTDWTNMIDFPLDSSNFFNPLITNLHNWLKIIKKSVSFFDTRLIFNKIVSFIFIIFYDYIVINNNFSEHGINKLQLDLNYIDTKLLEFFSNDKNESFYSYKSNKNFVKLSDSIKALNFILQKKNENDNIFMLKSSEFQKKFPSLTQEEIFDLSNRVL